MADSVHKARFEGDSRSLQSAAERAAKSIDNLTKANSLLAKQQLEGKRTLDSYNAAVANNNKQINSLQGVLRNSAGAMGKFGHANAQAVPAMQEVSRIVQDMPYGMHGVANNIQQLTAQFQYLSAKSGGATKALAAMGSALIGPAGILLAISAVTAFGPQLYEMLTKSKDALDDVKASVDDLTRAYDRYVQRSKDSQTLINEVTKMQVAEAKLRGAGVDEINRITAEGVSKRIGIIGLEIQERKKLIEKYRVESNALWQKGGEDNLKLADEYGLEAQKLRRKNEEALIEIQKMGNSIVLADLEAHLSKKEDMIKKSQDRIVSLFRDVPSFSGMGVPGFGQDGGAFSGMFLGLDDDLITPEWALPTVDNVSTGMDQISEAIAAGGEKVMNVGGAIAAGFSNFGQSIGNALASGTLSIETAGNTLLATFGDFLASFGTALIAWGFAKSVLDSLSISGVAAIAAGTALVIAGKALSASATAGLKSVASGGSASISGGGGSSSFSGSTAQAASVNTGGRYVFEIEGTKLVGVLSNTLARNRALGTDLNF